MTTPFESNFRPDNSARSERQDLSPISHLERVASGNVDFLSRHAGESFNQGLYRIHAVHGMARWTETVATAFPSFKGRIFCFSYDWLGRHFAIDFQRHQQSQFLLLMLEPGTGQALEIPTTFADFHAQELIHHQDAALAVDFYRTWRAQGGLAPDAMQCVGYKQPLFLGGSDSADNLELADMDVYWSLCGQLLAKTRSLPENARINNLRTQLPQSRGILRRDRDCSLTRSHVMFAAKNRAPHNQSPRAKKQGRGCTLWDPRPCETRQQSFFMLPVVGWLVQHGLIQHCLTELLPAEAGRLEENRGCGLKSFAHDLVTRKLSPPSSGSVPSCWRMYSWITSSVTLPLDATK